MITNVTIAGTEYKGLLYGGGDQFIKQIVAVAVVAIFAAVATFVIMKIVDLVVGIRVPEEEEVLGLDPSQHGELAYQL